MKKDDSKQKQRVKNYLLPSIRLPGRGLPLNMAAVHPKMDFNRHEREREDRKGTVTVHHKEKREMEEKQQY